MAVRWQLSGSYFENCSCDVVCPCLLSTKAQLTSRPTKGVCDVGLVFHIDTGSYDDIRLDGLSVALVARAPGPMADGNLSAAAYIDERADDRQTAALGAIFTGAEGGPMAEWQMDVERGTATLIAPATKLGKLELALAPMLGCFGVAPPRGQAISTATSGEHGGNMDYRGFVAGVTVYFPVFVPGALIHVGDGHAIQGDGEIVGTGIEISMDVQFTARLIKGKRIGWPRGENAEYIFTVGNARPLDQALQHATTEMLRWLEADYGLDKVSASILLGQAVEYDLGNVYDPAYTMVCKLRKNLIADL